MTAGTSVLAPLRPYQEEAIKMALRRGNLLLATTMGSGKTRIIIEIVRTLAAQGQVVSGTVFALAGIKYQWEGEIAKWDPAATVQVIDGPRDRRARQYRQAHTYDYNILNYDLLIHDWPLIQEYLPLDYVICDEATAIKSFKAKRSKKVKALGRAAEYRFAMSGQPVENRPEELFSIMEFVDPTVLGPFAKFDNTFIRRDSFGRPKNYRNLDVLRERLKPAMFRRSREDIAAYLPKIVPMETPTLLDEWSQEVYEHIRDDLLDVLDLALAAGLGGFDLMAHYGRADGGDNNKFKGLIMSRITAMRLLCDHPQLLVTSAAEFDDPDSPRGSQYASELLSERRFGHPPTLSGKQEALVDIVLDVLAEDPKNKVVVFSGFKGMLSLIAGALKKHGVQLTGIDGTVAARERNERIQRFNTSADCRVFLSSDAGQYGVNLDQGSHLVSYDLPWSAGAFAQRLARIDRLSSQHGSIVINSMYCQATIEERQYAMLNQKRSISEAFLDGKFDEEGKLQLSLSSLREFLSA